MNLSDCILFLYPDARPGVDFMLIDRQDGKGPKIAGWAYQAAPEPSMVGLQAVADEAARHALARDVRAERDQRVAVDDWLVQRHRDQVDAGTPTVQTAAQYSALLVYRQALRDVPQQAGFPSDVDWPARPF